MSTNGRLVRAVSGEQAAFAQYSHVRSHAFFPISTLHVPTRCCTLRVNKGAYLSRTGDYYY